MGQLQSVQDPLGINRLVQQLNIQSKERAQEPIRALQTELLSGQVEQQRGQLTDQRNKRQETLGLKAEFDKFPNQNKEFTALNYLKKVNPERAKELEADVFKRGAEIGKISGPDAFAAYVNERTGQNLKVKKDKGDLWKMDTGDAILVYDWRKDKVVKSFPKAEKGGETITTNPDGSVTISRGASAKPKRFSEVQTKSGGFADRVQSSNELLNTLEDTEGFDPAGIAESIAGGIPGAGNLLISEEKQRYNQAKQNFITANLRLESGAAIAKDEFDKEDKKFFPQPGDSPSVIKQKRDARIRQFDILRAASAGFYDEVQKQREKRIASEQTKTDTEQPGQVLNFDAQGNQI